MDFSFTIDHTYYWDALHFLGSFFLVAIFNQILALPDAFKLSIWCGHIWEVKDAWEGKKYSVKDLTFDIAGSMAYFIMHRKDKNGHSSGH